ncbi:unnamed protein product [Arctia plantaginis]|uniref:Uncharacterized protein n=1 Tax=Arctia plantaginis TaxID=874455 RepID=A0A8S1A5D2_ARCPL|nr:unnamed protein product [Arctia plantaginis]
MESLDLVLCSRANAKQRKGCDGRVMTGVSVQLYTSNHNLLDQPIPGIHRVPLDQLVLKIKILLLFQDMSIHEVLVSSQLIARLKSKEVDLLNEYY